MYEAGKEDVKEARRLVVAYMKEARRLAVAYV